MVKGSSLFSIEPLQFNKVINDGVDPTRPGLPKHLGEIVNTELLTLCTVDGYGDQTVMLLERTARARRGCQC